MTIGLQCIFHIDSVNLYSVMSSNMKQNKFRILYSRNFHFHQKKIPAIFILLILYCFIFVLLYFVLLHFAKLHFVRYIFSCYILSEEIYPLSFIRWDYLLSRYKLSCNIFARLHFVRCLLSDTLLILEILTDYP